MMVETITRRKTSFLDSSLKIAGIIDILSQLKSEAMYNNQLFRNCDIKYKPSFGKYLNYCAANGFVCSYQVPIRGNHVSKFEKQIRMCKYYKYYKLTDKGRTFLEMFNLA